MNLFFTMMVLLPAQRQSSRQECWCVPRVPASWKAMAGNHRSPGVWSQFGNYGETLSLKIDDKNQSLAFQKGVCYLQAFQRHWGENTLSPRQKEPIVFPNENTQIQASMARGNIKNDHCCLDTWPPGASRFMSERNICFLDLSSLIVEY